MKRRDFLKASLLGGAAAVTGLSRSETGSQEVPPFEFDETTIADLRKSIQDGSADARSITKAYLTRIKNVDQDGPRVNSVIELNPDAVEIAEELDQRKGPRGVLYGIPVLIKDNIGTADRMATTAGSLALTENHVGEDAYLVKRLRKAGAIILGKTNLSEWANFRSTHSSSGWSGRGGQTHNPYALDRNPCGSSSGSGAAASANFCAVAVGTETDGSIVCPSATNGLVGIKPTLGLVSRTGIIPLSHSQDTAGPMARTVRDAAVLLGVLAGPDPTDASTKGQRAEVDYTKFLDKAGLTGARIGVARKFFGFHGKVDLVMHEAILALKDAGAIIIDPADLPSHGKYDDSEFEVLLYDFKADLDAYLKTANPKVQSRSLKALIDFNRRHKETEMPFFGQEIFEMAQAKGPLTEKKYLEALAKNHRLSREEGIDSVMNKYKLDAILAPTGGPAWTTDLINGDHFSGGSSTPAAVSGYPAITVPAGYVRGLPVGLTLFGSAWSEGKLIKLAYAFEQATKVRKAPKFRLRDELE
ncbi:MAG: amidase [Fimbriimonadaceae bacterium]|nr:amidase [Fimbriimonadaceae bacterium]